MPAENLILFKRSNIHGKVPSLTSLSAGELAINSADGSLFTKTFYNNQENIVKFLNLNNAAELINQLVPYSLNNNLSSVTTVFDGNISSQVFATVLGGYSNNNSGAGSTIINGEANNISADFAFIANGINNKIIPTGNYSSILGGVNNFISHQNSYTLGSNLSSHSSNYTYVNNLCAKEHLHGTLIDWMTLVRGYKTTPTLNTTIATGEVWNYVYTSSPSDKTYYRFIATDGSEDSFYSAFNGTSVSGLIAGKAITI